MPNVTRRKSVDQSQLRVTLLPWPGQTLPLPDRWVVPYRLDDRGVLTPAASPETAMERVPADDVGESYLELVQLDLDNVDAIIAFVSRYGTLGIRRNGWAVLDELELASRAWRPVRPVLEQAVRASDAGSFEETLAEFRFGARLVRDLVQAVRFIRGDLDETEPEWISALDREEVPTGLMVAAFVDSAFTVGLRFAHPRVFEHIPLFEAPKTSVFGNAYGAACLEFYNHIVEEAEYRRCQNEKCGRFFVRQRGRAKHGFHRLEGVIYCSPGCARAQTQRQYRRRKQREKAGERDA